jgi:hypothetical protein
VGMSLKLRVGKLEVTHGIHRKPGGKPTFREWLVATDGMNDSELDPRIQTFRDFVSLNHEKRQGIRRG